MLLEPGPLWPFLTSEIPQTGPAPAFAAIAAEEAGALEDAARAIAPALLAMASAPSSILDGADALELAAAAEEHDRQSREADSAIVGVAAAADAEAGDVAALQLALAGDLATAPPDDPVIPPDVYLAQAESEVITGPPMVKGQWEYNVQIAFRVSLRRFATREELDYSQRWNPNLNAMRNWVAGGAPLT